MTNTATAPTRPTTDRTPTDHDWRRAGAAWGHAATDWSCLFEHYSTDAVTTMFTAIGVHPGTRLLDVACGSGLAIRRATDAGATVAGIDAAERLVEVARSRSPQADVRLGSMFELPWDDGSFDAVLSVNGIWGGCEAALDEAHRVLRPGGRIGLSFWGKGDPLDLKPFFIAVAGHLDPAHVSGMVRTNDIAKPGVAEEMLAACGFEVESRSARVSVVEWPDADIAWRALRSIGPIVPALEAADEGAVRRDVLAAIDHCRDDQGVYRFRNDHQVVTARRSG